MSDLVYVLSNLHSRSVYILASTPLIPCHLGCFDYD
nr:MAG TPA: hypothetical protein [Caudoviricetes sp.]